MCSGSRKDAWKVSTTFAPVMSKTSRTTPGRERGAGLEPQPEVERARELGDAQRRLRRVAGGVDLLDRVGELVGDVAGHLLGDALVVALEEDQPDHELQRRRSEPVGSSSARPKRLRGRNDRREAMGERVTRGPGCAQGRSAWPGPVRSEPCAAGGGGRGGGAGAAGGDGAERRADDVHGDAELHRRRGRGGGDRPGAGRSAAPGRAGGGGGGRARGGGAGDACAPRPQRRGAGVRGRAWARRCWRMAIRRVHGAPRWRGWRRRAGSAAARGSTRASGRTGASARARWWRGRAGR